MTDKKVVLAAPQDGFTNRYLADALDKWPISVTGYDYREQMRRLAKQTNATSLPPAAAEMGKNLVYEAETADLVIALKGELIPPATFDDLRERGVTTALWHFDPRDGRQKWVVERAQAVDHFFTIAEGLLDYYEPRGVNAHHLWEACDPRRHYPTPPDGDVVDVSFVGTVEDVSGRAGWLAAIENLHDLHLWGSFPGSFEDRAWYHGRAEGDEGLRRAIARSKVNLGRDRCPHLTRSYGARLFRTLACGGFVLTNDTTGIRDDFGDCVGVYEDTEDCIEQITYWKESDDTRRARAKKGRQRVIGEHTWAHRAQSLLKTTGVIP